MKLRFNLALKFLLPLNLVVLSFWSAFAYWNLKSIEKNHIQAEVQTIKHLGLGLRAAVEQTARGKTTMKSIQQALDHLSAEEENLDIMIIDRQYRVLAATYKSRIGKRWFEPDIQAVLEGKTKVIWKTASHRHEGHRAFDTTIGVFDVSGRPIYAIHIARRLDLVERAMNQQVRRDILFTVIIFVVIGLAVNALTYLLVIRRLDRILHKVSRTEWIDDADRSVKGDEVTELDQVLSRMMQRVEKTTENLRNTIEEKDGLIAEVERLKASLAQEVERVRRELTSAQSHIVRLERQSAQAELTSILAHEVRNPLHIIRGTAEVLARRVETAAPLAKDIMDEVDRVEHLIKELLDLSRPIQPKIQTIALPDFLDEVCRTARLGSRSTDTESSTEIVVEIQGAKAIQADPLLLRQALVNLLDNALGVSPDEATLLVQVEVSAGLVCFTVRDQGPGLAPEAAQRAFEPFFTMKSEGIGLGLAIVKRVADLHGGEATLREWESGTEALLCIPQPPKGSSGSWPVPSQGRPRQHHDSDGAQKPGTEEEPS